MNDASTYTCEHCGQTHEGLPTDWGFQLPDEVFALPYLEQYRRARFNEDLCTLDESRYFLRGVLSIPLSHQAGQFGWGLWVEVDRATHDFYLAHFRDDATQAPPARGTVANEIPLAPDLLGEAVEVRFWSATQRPRFILPASCHHAFARDQAGGIDAARHHEYLESVGYFDEDDADDEDDYDDDDDVVDDRDESAGPGAGHRSNH